MYQCKTCQFSLENEHYRFCSETCQNVYYLVTEKKISMRHPYKASEDGKCETCNRDMMSHFGNVKCESCSRLAECDIVEDMLICLSCETQLLKDRSNQVNENISTITGTQIGNASRLDKDVSELLNEARKIDVAMRFNGDFFNAQTIANIDVKKSIDSNDSIPKESKESAYSDFLMERFNHFQETIFKLDEQKFENLQRMASIKKSLREFGNDLRKEYREKLAQSDAQYVPAPVVKPKVKGSSKKNKPVYEMMIETIMKVKGCTREQALQVMIEKEALNIK